MKTGWRTAFIAQGESDFRIYKYLSDVAGVEPCHVLHYLQMAAEKIAKGLNCRDEFTKPEETHYSLVRWLRLAKANPYQSLMRICGIATITQFRTYVQSLTEFAELVETLAPAIARQRGVGRNAEYPWLNVADSTVIYPAAYPFTEIIYSPKYMKFIRFLESSIAFGKMGSNE